MKKVMFHLNTLERGGMERVVVNLASHFADDGYDAVVATEWTGEVEYDLPENVRRINVGLTKSDVRKGRIGKILARQKNFRKCVKSESPDIIFAFNKKAIYRALIATIGIKVPVVLAVRNSPVGNYDSFIDKLLICMLYPKASGAVFQTPECKNFFVKNLKRESRIILNPLNDILLGQEKASERSKRIVSVGRFVRAKNQLLLVKAFEIIKDRYPEYSLEFYGGSGENSNYYNEVKKYILDNGLGNRVFFKGHDTNVYDSIKNASVFVLSSDNEGMPNVLMEAMALGIPVVTTDCEPGGARLLVKDGVNGRLVERGNQQVLADAIATVIENPIEAEEMADKAMDIQIKANPFGVYEEWRDYALEVIEGRNRKG